MAQRSDQLSFEGFKRPSDSFGGGLLKSHPKTKRPLDSKYATLVTLRANRSCLRLPGKMHQVDDLVHDAARKYGIKIYDYANVGNHLHFIAKLTHKRFWAPFIREVTSQIAALFQSSHSGNNFSRAKLNPIGDSAKTTSSAKSPKPISHSKAPKFWKFRPHTRIIRSWKKAFKIALAYIQLNKAEAGGFIERSQVKNLKAYRMLFDVGMISMRPERAS